MIQRGTDITINPMDALTHVSNQTVDCQRNSRGNMEYSLNTKKQAEMSERSGWSSCLSSMSLKRSWLEVATRCGPLLSALPTERVSSLKHGSTRQSQCGKSLSLSSTHDVQWPSGAFLGSLLTCRHCARFRCDNCLLLLPLVRLDFLLLYYPLTASSANWSHRVGRHHRGQSSEV
jgi:hypothetical protein